MLEEQLTQKIIGCAFNVYNVLGFGFLEKVYENAFRIEMELQGLKVEQQMPISVFYKGEIAGNYCADLLVENKVLIELKSIQALSREHEVQLVNYLKATGISIGLLINFGPTTVQIKRRLKEMEKSD